MLEKVVDKFSGVIRTMSGKSSITEKNVADAVENIKEALIDADVNIRVIRRFINRTREEALGETVLKAVNPGQQFVSIVHNKMTDLLGGTQQELQLHGPDVISCVLMLGLQGAGKTTSVVKLASHLQKNRKRRVLMVAADLLRPAAIDQLEILGSESAIAVYSNREAHSPLQVAREAMAKAKRELYDTVLLDTSGRLHVDDALMTELSTLHAELKPVESLLVLDAMTGQNAVTIAHEFLEYVDYTGVILTKFDSDTRGGAALSLKEITRKPIKFVGVGEKLADLEIFYPERIASRILGMGDIVTLVEKAQEHTTQEEALALQKKMLRATFTLEDYLAQMRVTKKMGSMDKLLELMPGAQSIDTHAIDFSVLKKEEAILSSMTKQERANHIIIGNSRKKRIAKGSGSSVIEVNRLLKNFEKMRSMMKKISKNKKMYAQAMAHYKNIQK